jgi:hypothetical protein
MLIVYSVRTPQVFNVPPGLGMKTVYAPSRSWSSLGLPKDQKKRDTTLRD